MIISIGHKLNVCRPSAQRKMTLLFIALVIQEDVRTELAFNQGCTNRCSLAAGLRGNEERMRK